MITTSDLIAVVGAITLLVPFWVFLRLHQQEK